MTTYLRHYCISFQLVLYIRKCIYNKSWFFFPISKTNTCFFFFSYMVLLEHTKICLWISDILHLKAFFFLTTESHYFIHYLLPDDWVFFFLVSPWMRSTIKIDHTIKGNISITVKKTIYINKHHAPPKKIRKYYHA